MRRSVSGVEILASTTVYAGIIVAIAGLLLMVRPVTMLGVSTRWEAFAIVAIGLLVASTGFALRPVELHADSLESRLDELFPAWQFGEHHRIEIDAPPAQAFAAVKSVRADEIALFGVLTWLRRAGRPTQQSILNPGGEAPLIEIALRSGFVKLAEDPGRELVVATVVRAPSGQRCDLTAASAKEGFAEGYAVAAMNFLVKPDGERKSVVTTETRVVANGREAERQFARYWRLIYPGSALIRRMWLRAVRRRAMNP